MNSKVTAEQIVKALRCSLYALPKIDKCDHNCPWCDLDKLPSDLNFMADEIDELGVGISYSCDCDKLMRDAADLIEELMGRPTTVCNQHGENNYCIENCGTINL